MIVLDTNVVSEMMRPAPDARVASWVNAQPDPPFTTTITQAEVLYGIELLPAGRRRTAIESLSAAIFGVDFAGRVLPFAIEAAHEYAAVRSDRRRAGRPIAALDAQIAAIARVHGATLVTRNVADFDGCGVALVNPFG